MADNDAASLRRLRKPLRDAGVHCAISFLLSLETGAAVHMQRLWSARRAVVARTGAARAWSQVNGWRQESGSRAQMHLGLARAFNGGRREKLTHDNR